MSKIDKYQTSHSSSQGTNLCDLCQARLRVICEGHQNQAVASRSKTLPERKKQDDKKSEGGGWTINYSKTFLRTLTTKRVWMIAPGARISYRTLDLRKAKLEKLPEKAFSIDGLEAIRLDNNKQLCDVTFFTNLTELRVAVLKNCDIKKLNGVGGARSSLRALELNNNPNLTNFSDLKLLSRLQYLNMGRCKLISVPLEVIYLRKLRVLVLDDNPLKTILVDFSFLINLQVLLMKNCGLTEVPSSIYDLKELLYLSIEQNKISSVPSTLCRLTKLEVFSVYGNKNIHLHEKISRISALKRVNVDISFPKKTVSARMRKLIKTWKDTPSAWWKQL